MTSEHDLSELEPDSPAIGIQPVLQVEWLFHLWVKTVDIFWRSNQDKTQIVKIFLFKSWNVLILLWLRRAPKMAYPYHLAQVSL